MERKEEIKTKKSIKYRQDFHKLSGDVKTRYEEKIRLCGGIDPYTIKATDLSLASNDFPAITVSDIANYMISSTSPYTKQSFNAFKSTEAYKFFESGFVINVGSKNENGLSILKGRVNHSQKLNETPVEAWILAKLNGQIICAHCTCTAGLSETCSHVGAICFAVASMCESPEIKSVTDELCKWNVPSFKKVSMSEAVKISWKPNPFEQRSPKSNFRLYCDSLTNLSDERIIEFIEKCNSNGDRTALETIMFPDKKIRKTKIRDEVFLGSLFNETYRNKSHGELVEIGKAIALNITNDEVREISHSTLPHLKSICSVGLRRGRITGPQFKNCCVTCIDAPSITTIHQLIMPTKLDDVPSVKYQIKNKKTALDQYRSIAISEHIEFSYDICGLIINPKFPYFAGSIDGLLSCKCHGNGCLEIKCLKILESNPSFDILTDEPNKILNKQDGLYVLEKSHELYYQIQFQINLISLNYCDLVIWSPKEFLVIRVEPDVSFWKNAMNKALKFHEQVAMPELLGKFYTKNGSKKQKKDALIELEIEILDHNETKSDEIGEPEEDILIDTEEHKNELEPNNFDEVKELVSHGSECEKESWPNKIQENGKANALSEVDVNVFRNLMKESIDDILLTFYDHRDELKRLYNEQISQFKRNYKVVDLPDMVAFDIVTEKQFQEMAHFAETNLANVKEEHNSTDVIFDAIIPQWALAAFCKKYNLSRTDAVEILQTQSKTLIENLDA